MYNPIPTCECASPQEQRLFDKIQGKEGRFRKTHTRVFQLLERFDGQKPRIDIERALYFTQSMKETEGQPLVLRWAKALMHIAQNITVYVQEDQLLLGPPPFSPLPRPELGTMRTLSSQSPPLPR